MSVLVIIKKMSEDDYYKHIAHIKEMYFGCSFSVIAIDIPVIEKKINRVDVYNVDSSAFDIVSVIDGLTFRYVVLVGFEESERLPLSILYACLEKEIESIKLFKDEQLHTFMPFSAEKSNTILVFPGPILPLNMGAHQRVFNLIASLNYSGCFVDIIITGGNKAYVKRCAGLLKVIAPNVFTYTNNKKKLSKLLTLRRDVENFYRRSKGIKGPAPELFADRLWNKATYSLQKTLKQLVLERKYRNVIVSYAWMSNAGALFSQEESKAVNWYCDTHDVQYVRNSSMNKNSKRFLALSRWDKKIEQKTLSKYKKIFAISDSDFENLESDFGEKVIKVTSAFDYAYKENIKKNERHALNFGFIGGKMDANVQAVKFILRKWWPRIKQHSPSSKLYLAGSLCNVDDIITLCEFDNSIVMLGFVNKLSDFYDKIDIALNPVLVQGGLNFKSVEAVVSGKLLITNELGSKCLGKSNICSIVNSPDQLIKELLSFEIDKVGFYEVLKKRKLAAREYFGDEEAYSAIRRLLNE